MLEKEQIAQIVGFARAYPVIAAMYLFGSHASGYARSKSDIDLGIPFHGDVDGFKRINMETEISNQLKKEVELVT